MNLDEERQNSQNFQDDEKQYEGNSIDLPTSNHPFTDNAEPDYAEDLANTEQNSEEFGNNEFSDAEFDTEDQENDELSNESLENIDEEDELSTDGEGTNPNRNQ